MSHLRLLQNKYYLNTGISQIETNKILTNGIKSTMKIFAENKAKHNIQSSVVLFYTIEDISKNIQDYLQGGDALECFNIGDSFFHFVFLSNSTMEKTDLFIKSVECYKLCNIKYLFYSDRVPSDTHHLFNFINSFLFEINDKKKYMTGQCY